nr:10547_t:CDS:2 [Entrophospora candida]
MKCSQCKIEKLSKEFFSSTITERCQHVTSFCLRCLITQLNAGPKQNCPECNQKLGPEELKAISLAWDKAPFKVDIDSIGSVVPTNQPSDTSQGAAATGVIYIASLDGTKRTFQIKDIKTIVALRGLIKNEFKVDPMKQKLIFNGKELQDYTDSRQSTLSDFGVVPGGLIQLIVVLYSISKAEAIKNLTFDLFWDYPTSGATDYLDGTCLVYAGVALWKKYDYASVFYPKFPHMKHSGDVMDGTNKKGHQRITAKLDQLPPEVTQLYFILSSYLAPTISNFPSKNFKMYDEATPDKELVKCTFDNANNSQAVIMCCVRRARDGMWEVIPINRAVGGNVNNYDLIEIGIGEVGLMY